MRIRYHHLTFLALAVASVVALAAPAIAVPPINGVVFTNYVYGDCPFSTLAESNLYPASVEISDQNLDCLGYANLHTWSYSNDLLAPAEFLNGDHFQHGATLLVDGTGQGEAGLRISPWWSPNVDGRFNCRTTDGEIAVFSGRLPFYSFTANHGVLFTKGTPVRIDIIYWPNSNSSANPGSIQYKLGIGANSYSSPLLFFDQANPGEDPPHGLWGILTPAYVGGYLQIFNQPGPTDGLTATWSNLTITQAPTDTKTTSWGRIKALYR